MSKEIEPKAPLTRLGRVVQATTDTAAALSLPRHPERHRKTNWLRDVILGGQDGLVNILGIILGVIAGGGSDTVLLVTGFAAAITESISMGAVGYTSSVSERDYYEAEKAREVSERSRSLATGGGAACGWWPSGWGPRRSESSSVACSTPPDRAAAADTGGRALSGPFVQHSCTGAQLQRRTAAQPHKWL